MGWSSNIALSMPRSIWRTLLNISKAASIFWVKAPSNSEPLSSKLWPSNVRLMWLPLVNMVRVSPRPCVRLTPMPLPLLNSNNSSLNNSMVRLKDLLLSNVVWLNSKPVVLVWPVVVLATNLPLPLKFLVGKAPWLLNVKKLWALVSWLRLTISSSLAR